MANKDLANGFNIPKGVPYYAPRVWPATASQTFTRGDMVYLDSAGRITIATATTAAVSGVSYTPVVSSTAGDDVWVFDNPMQEFEGQCSGSGALADPYTCATLASCFDIEGTTGIMEINEDANSYDMIHIIGVGTDPATGVKSAVGANQRKIFRINGAKHQLRLSD